ncbi:hypothetical protein B0H14DRAFT_2590347 [Mycena olivaceomarginata]|nr:hypothetical protein B0H14DRAFT_2590347 [Mycena olivaceomarginata]
MAETFVNENIDPSLRAIDPTRDIFLRIRGAGLTPAPATDNNDMDDSNDMPATLHFPVGPSTGPSISNPSVSYASLVKNKMALSDAASVALDQFCQARAEDREVLLFAHVVQLLELFKKNEKMELWVISQDLDRKIVTYVKAFVFSPTTVSYRGLNVGEHILSHFQKAMRECKVKSLPDDDDTTANDLVLTRIREKCFRRTRAIKATVQVYQRVALVRWCFIQFPDLEDDEFWPKAVDHTIDQFRKQSSNQGELDLCFTAIYEDDKKQYSDPATTEFKAADIDQGPAWQVTLGKHARNIQVTPQAPSGPPTKKRKVAARPEADDESDNDDD